MPEKSSTETSTLAFPFPNDDPVEAYLDGDLDLPSRRRFEARLADDPELAAELDLARRVRSGLRALPRHRCPEGVSRAALEAIEAGTESWETRRSIDWRGALAAAALLAVTLLAGASFFDVPRFAPPSPPSTTLAEGSRGAEESRGAEPTPAEIARAKEEVELAFAYLGELGRTASAGMREIAVEKTGVEKRSEP